LSSTFWVNQFAAIVIVRVIDFNLRTVLDDLSNLNLSQLSKLNYLGYFIKEVNPLYWDDCVYNMFTGHKYNAALKVVHEFSREIIAKRRVLLEEELENRRATQTADDDM